MSQADSRVSHDFPNDPVYAGLDFGDWIPLTNGNGVNGLWLPMKGIPGNWHDFMSYCPLKWIGPYTYDTIRSAVLSSEFPIYILPGGLFSDSSPLSIIYIRHPRVLPPRKLMEGLMGCFRGGLDDPKGILEYLRNECGNGDTLILPNSENLSSSSSPSGMVVSPKILEGSHLPGISDKESSKHYLSVEKGRFIRVVASVDLSEHQGRITYARRVTLALSQSEPTDNRILLRMTDRKGK